MREITLSPYVADRTLWKVGDRFVTARDVAREPTLVIDFDETPDSTVREIVIYRYETAREEDKQTEVQVGPEGIILTYSQFIDEVRKRSDLGALLIRIETAAAKDVYNKVRSGRYKV